MFPQARYVSTPVCGPWGFDRLDLALDAGDVGYLGIAAGRRWFYAVDGPTALTLANRFDAACLGSASLHDRREVPAELTRLRRSEAGVVASAVRRPIRTLP